MVRKNGSWEVYSDFKLVSESNDWENQCVDVEVDFDKFYLKFAELDASNPVIKSYSKNDLKITVKTVYHSWGNRIYQFMK